MNNITLSFLHEIDTWESIIDHIWQSSNFGCLWNTKEMHKAILCYLRDKYNTKDFSFIVFQDNNPIGYFFFPAYFYQGEWHGGWATYWPCFLLNYKKNSDLIEYIFTCIDQICLNNSIGKLSLKVNASAIDFQLYASLIRKFCFIDESYASHIIKLSDFTLMSLRAKYRQIIKRNISSFKVECINLDQINDAIIKDYYNLHTLDAGGVQRSYDTYVAQFHTLTSGGFVVCAYDKNTIPVGMLMINVGKKEAIDSSVAVHPEYAKFGISLLLKLQAIERLKSIGIDIYELGQTSYYSTFSYVPQKKNYGISHFKEGWARGNVRIIHSATKFYTESALSDFLEKQKKLLWQYTIEQQLRREKRI